MTTKGKTLASYSPELRERAVRLVLEGAASSRHHPAAPDPSQPPATLA